MEKSRIELGWGKNSGRRSRKERETYPKVRQREKRETTSTTKLQVEVEVGKCIRESSGVRRRTSTSDIGLSFLPNHRTSTVR